MPEGPQMVFLKELAEQFSGQRVVRIAGSAKNIPFDEIKGKVLKEIRTFGKELLFCFDAFTIRVHLMLFGKYAINSTLNRNLKLGFEFEEGEMNFYSCDCRFIPHPVETVYNWKADVMNSAFDAQEAINKIKKKPAELICEALLNQDALAGVGNKLKNESLFRQKVHPLSTVGQIPEQKIKALVDECVALSALYLKWQHEGEVESHWTVYKKKECPRDHIPLHIEKTGRSARTSYFCEKCQELYT